MDEVRTRHKAAPVSSAEATAELIAVIVAVTDGEPRVLTIDDGRALPSGPFELTPSVAAVGHALLGGAADPPSAGLCRAALHLRRSGPDADRPAVVSISYLGLTREARGLRRARRGLAELVSLLPLGGSPQRHARGRGADRREAAGLGRRCGGRSDRRDRLRRIGITFGHDGRTWNEELILQRYELLWEAGLVPEAPPGERAGRRRADDA